MTSHKQAAAALAPLLAIAAATGILHAQPVDRFASIAPRMQQFVDKGEAAGVVTLIANRDRILHLNAVGKSDLTADRKMSPDDIFWIASMSKPITAVCIAILADDGKLDFDDPLAKHLPEFAALMADRTRPVTLRDLLTHTSGMGETMTRDPHLTLAETAAMLSRQPLRFQPGARFAYSTAGIDVLGRVVEVASGMTFDQFLQKRVLDPLRMKDTGFWVAPEKESRYAHTYRWNAQTSKLEPNTIPYMYNTAVTDRGRPPLGGAGLFSTAVDISRFYRMMLNQGTLDGARILKPATVAEMTRKQTGDLAARPGMPWGLGFCVVEDPSKMAANSVLSPNSFGHGGAFSTGSWADPVKGLVWIVMFERDGHGNPDNSDVRIAFQEAATGAAFLRRQTGDSTAAYKPLFGSGDRDAAELKSVARYGEVTVAPGGATAIVSYPAEEQIYFIEEGSGTLLYGSEKAAVTKNSFMYLPAGIAHGLSNPSDAPLKAIVMGYTIPVGIAVQPTPKLMLANADDVPLQILGQHGPSCQFKLLMGTTTSKRDKLAAAYVVNSLFLMDFAPGGTNIPHNHPNEEEIYFLLRGSGDMVAGLDTTGKEVRHPVTAGAAFLFKPGTQVGYYSNSKEGQPHDLILAVRSRLP